MYRANDILIRKTTDGDTIWVSQRLIVEICGVSDEYSWKIRTIYKRSLPKSWLKIAEKSEFYLGDTGKSWRWGRKNGQYYYDYDRIPDRTPANYRSMLPTKAELIETVEANNLRVSRERDVQSRNILLEAVIEFENNEDAHWINTRSGYQIDIATSRDYAKALAWCRFIKQTVNNRKLDIYGVKTVAAFYELCAGILRGLQIKNLKTNTPKTLRNKIMGMPMDIEEQRAWVISAKYGNNNRQIVGKINLIDYETGEIYPYDIHQAIMYAAYMNLDGPEKESLTALYDGVYSPLISDFGYTPIEYRTFCNHLSRFSTRLLNDRARHGDEYYKKQLLTYIPSEKLSYSHSLFCGDGSGLFAYHYRNKAGELKYMNLYAILISDVSSGYIAGWAVAPEGLHCETPEMVKQAVKMAVKNGGNQTMFEFVSDNHGAFTKDTSRTWLKSVFNRVRTIAPHNSQANPAETQFRLFKNSTLRSMKNFVRTSHNASIDSRANLDKIDIYQYPTFPEAIEQLKERIDMWNNTLRRGINKTPAELFNNNKNPQCQQMDAIKLRQIFGTHTQIEVTRNRGFVIAGPRGAEITYEIPDYETTGYALISRATGNEYYAHVDIVFDGDGADIYSADGKYVMTCPRVSKASQSYIEKTEQQRLNENYLATRKSRALETVARHETNIADAFNLLENWGYEADVKFGGDKESINEAYEGLINIEIKSKQQKEAQNGLIKVKRKELKQQEKEHSKTVSDMQSRHSALLKRRLPEIYK